MTLSRRLFLGALAAPAIVRASSLMPIWVPRQQLTYDELSFRYLADFRAALTGNVRTISGLARQAGKTTMLGELMRTRWVNQAEFDAMFSSRS